MKRLADGCRWVEQSATINATRNIGVGSKFASKRAAFKTVDVVRMHDILAVYLAHRAIAAVTVGAVIVHRSVAVLLGAIVLGTALDKGIGAAVIVDGFILQQA